MKFRLLACAAIVAASGLSMGPQLAQAQYPCNYPGGPPCSPYPQQMPVQQFGVRCYTQFGPCFMGQALPLGSPCACPGPYGMIPGQVGA